MIKLKKETVHVNSQAILSATYDYNNKSLALKFNNGKKYKYINVTPETFLSMKYAESIGKFINKYIIRNSEYAIQ